METAKQLYERIMNAAANEPALAGLDGATLSYEEFIAALDRQDAAAWTILAYTIAQVQVDTIVTPFARHVAEMDAVAASIQSASAAYLEAFMLSFQLGDQLTVISSGDGKVKVGYAVVDASKQIIKYASVTEIGGQAIIKIAKADSGGYPTPLSTAELAQVRDALTVIYAPGADWVVSSTLSDQLKLEGDFYYNGEVGLSAFQANLVGAIKTYCRQNRFGGVFRLNGSTDAPGLIDYLQANVPGFRAPNIRAFIKSAVLPVYTEFVLQAALQSGFVTFDEASSTLNYIAE